MKVIQLLNKIANGEEVPKNIKVGGYILENRRINMKKENIIKTLDITLFITSMLVSIVLSYLFFKSLNVI